MAVNTKEMNIFEKLAAIRKMVEALQKNKSGYGYKYVSEDEILAKVTAGLEKYGLDVFPSLVPGTTVVLPHTTKKTKASKDGKIYEENVNEVIVSSEMNFQWVNLDNPSEKYDVPWIIVGQQSDVSQALGSGLTYCTRYFYLKFFKSSTLESDPDNWRSKQEEAKRAEDKLVAADIIKEVDAIVKEKVTEDNRPEITNLIKKFAVKKGKASADYTAIEDPVVASNLLNAVIEFFKN